MHILGDSNICGLATHVEYLNRTSDFWLGFGQTPVAWKVLMNRYANNLEMDVQLGNHIAVLMSKGTEGDWVVLRTKQGEAA